MEIIDCEQGTEIWFAARMGMPTTSQFSTILAKGRGGGESKSRKTYMMKLAGERLTGEPMDNYSNAHMERGHEMEGEARDLYAFANDAELTQVGFIINGTKGCSPDALSGEDGMVEIKTKLPHLLIDVLLKGTFPPEHVAQCQGALWVAEREWIDLVIYWPKLPLFIKRAYRDEEYIKALSGAVDQFNDELAALVEKVRQINR